MHFIRVEQPYFSELGPKFHSDFFGGVSLLPSKTRFAS